MKGYISTALTIWTLTGLGSSIALSAQAPKSDAAKDQTSISVEDRKEMAAVHEKMAACLRSNKPIDECREEMWTSCQKMMGDDCPMMGGGRGYHRGRMHRDDE